MKDQIEIFGLFLFFEEKRRQHDEYIRWRMNKGFKNDIWKIF